MLIFYKKKLSIALFDLTNTTEYTIHLKTSKQLPYKQIYSLELVKIKTLKTYIKINLTNNFIYISKFLTIIFILFISRLI